nr:mevalonate kinase [Mycobacterium ulcerans]
MKARSRSGVGTATGKAIVLGEHLVVHGAAALAIPIPILVETATAHRGPAPTPVRQPTVGSMGLDMASLISDFAERFDVPAAVASGVVVEVSHVVPCGRRLGSSAAVVRAVVLALADLFECEPSAAQVYELVQSRERTAHGTPSGVDAAATGADGPIVFHRGAVRPVSPAPVGVFVVADSGEISATKDSVAEVAAILTADRDGLARRDWLVEQLDALVGRAAIDMQQGDLTALGAAMARNHDLLRGLNLSTPRLEGLIEAANTSGAMGAKLTGSGRVGCALALARDWVHAQVIGEAMLKAGAVATWAVALDSFAGRLTASASGREVAP